MNGLKLWWVWCGDNYYPTSALGDFSAAFEHEFEAQAHADKIREEGVCDWVEVAYVGDIVGAKDPEAEDAIRWQASDWSC